MEIAQNPQNIQTTQDGIRNVTILCCLCGTAFSASSTGTNICLKCISSQVDISEGITKEGTLEFCRKCERYLRPPWVRAELESKELLDICLKKIRGLNKVKLVDANFVWTEPHSKRVKVKLTVQKEVMNNASVQQSFVVEFVVNALQCEDCKKEFTPHKWRAVVQVRQRVDHKKTFLFIEQLILKHNIHEKMINVEEVNGGIDFFFKERAHAQKLVEFLQSILPIRVKPSKQLISHNEHLSTYNYKYSFSIDIPRICKDDLVVLKPKLANALGGCSRLLLCTKVASLIQLVDINNMKVIEITGSQYFQHEEEMMFISSKGNLVEFMVFDLETPQSKNQSLSFVGAKFKATRVTVGRVSDWENFEIKTHMGDFINEGSTVLGYDLTTFNLTGNYDELNKVNLPDVILVKKIFPDKKKGKKRIWKLKHLEKQERGTNNFHKANVQKDKDEKDYEEFLHDLETDAELRANINLYKDEKAIKDLEKQVEGVEENKSEVKQEEEEENNEKAGNKKKGKAKGKRKNVKKEEEESAVKKEEKKENLEKNEEEPQGIKIEELLADLNLDEKVVKVGQKLAEDDLTEENDDEDIESNKE